MKAAEGGQERASKEGALLGEKLRRSGELLLKRSRVVGGDEKVVIAGILRNCTLNRRQVKIKATGAEEGKEVTGKMGWLFRRAEDRFWKKDV